MKLILTTIIITFTYQLEETSATDLNSNDDVNARNVVRSVKTTASSVTNIVPIRILTDSNEKAPIMNLMNQFTNETHADADNNSDIEIDFLMEIQPTESSLDINYGNDVNLIEERSGFINTETEESETLDNLNHETDDIEYEEGDDKNMPEGEHLLKNNKNYDDITQARRPLIYHSNLDVKGRSGIPETKNPEALNHFKAFPFVPTFTGGYASHLSMLNGNENTFRSVMAPQYHSMIPASRIFYTSPVYTGFLPLRTQIRKIDKTEMIIPNVMRYAEPVTERSTVRSNEDTFKPTESEFILNNSESNSYPYEPLPSSNTNSNTEDSQETNLIFKKLLESSMNPKQFNEGEISP